MIHLNPSSNSDVITLKDIAKRIPNIAKKLPRVARGLMYAYSTDKSKAMGLAWAFEKTTEKFPNKNAILYQDVQFTYEQMNGWANQIAHYFQTKGLKKGDVAAIFIENRPELMASVLAMAKLGVTCAMINTSQTGKVLTHSINLVNPKVVLVGEECRVSLDGVMADLHSSEHQPFWFADQNTQAMIGTVPAGYTNLADEIRAYPRFNCDASKAVFYGDGLFYIYTSGTTGLPKAAVFTNGRWMKAYGTLGHVMDLNSNDVLYSTLPLYHATGMVIGWASAIVGAAAFAVRRRFSAREFWADILKFNASAIVYVGELCRYLTELPSSPHDRQHRVTKIIGNGMRPNIWGKFKQRFGIKEVMELYASSEGNVGFSNIFNFDNTVGFSPIPYAIVAYDKEANKPILDQNGFMKKVEKGGAGLLIGKITDRSPFDGYTDPEKSKASIFENVFEKGDRYFNTGDMVRDIGYRHAQFVDRLGDTFRWKGENVSTTEVENLISEHPKISEAVVYGVEIPNTNGRAGMSSITPIENVTFNADDYSEMLAFFRKTMPAYAVPVFIRIQEVMETTGTFKYQKNKLKEDAFNPNKVEGMLLVCLPGSQTYTPITQEVFHNINMGEYRF